MSDRFRCYEAPTYWDPAKDDPPGVFLAGGITGCPAWHQQAIDYLWDSTVPMVVLNPAREAFPIDNPDAGWEQVSWEQHHLHLPQTITLMWFPEPLVSTTVQPIAQFEFGQLLASPNRRFVVGAAPGYPRRRDVKYMMRLHRPDMDVRDTLEGALDDVVRLVSGR